MTDQTAALAGTKATVPDALDLGALILIGVMERQDGAAALLRSARGRVARVAVGEEAFGVRITAIGSEQVIIVDRWGRTQSLELSRG